MCNNSSRRSSSRSLNRGRSSSSNTSNSNSSNRINDSNCNIIVKCPKSLVRNGWRTQIWDNLSRLDAILKLYYDFFYFRHPYLRNHCVRNLWRALPFASETLLGVPWCHLGHQGRPWNPTLFLLMTVWATNSIDKVHSGGHMRTICSQSTDLSRFTPSLRCYVFRYFAHIDIMPVQNCLGFSINFNSLAFFTQVRFSKALLALIVLATFSI